MMGNTPAYDYGRASEYSQMNTPNYQGAFSPGPNNIGSPYYSATSPNPYATPYASESPVYRAAQSPIYQPI